MQFPIKGTEVFRDIPQQTPGALQEVQRLFTFFVQSGQTQIQIGLTVHQMGLSQEAPATFGQQYIQSLHDF